MELLLDEGLEELELLDSEDADELMDDTDLEELDSLASELWDDELWLLEEPEERLELELLVSEAVDESGAGPGRSELPLELLDGLDVDGSGSSCSIGGSSRPSSPYGSGAHSQQPGYGG